MSTSLSTSMEYGMHAGMGEMRKITVEVPLRDLENAQALTGQGVTETVRAALRKLASIRAQQELLTKAAQDTTRLADVRYRGGAASYLEVLDSDTRYFDAQLALAQAQLNERVALVQVYRVLGGGWQQ